MEKNAVLSAKRHDKRVIKTKMVEVSDVGFDADYSNLVTNIVSALKRKRESGIVV